jgi:uncharacterized protein (DUF1697 family)
LADGRLDRFQLVKITSVAVVIMHHYIAFLRGINLGKRRIKMDDLRVLFEQMKFTGVETFIASGNVIFASKSGDTGKLENKIQVHLKKSLGYEVDTFVRSRAEVAAIAAHRPFIAADLDHPNHTVHAGFFSEPPLRTRSGNSWPAGRTWTNSK